MREVMMSGIVLAVTVLLLFFRSQLFRRRRGKSYRVYLMNRTDGHDGGPSSDAAEEWPSVIAVEDDSASGKRSFSEDERIELAVMQDRILRLLP